MIVWKVWWKFMEGRVETYVGIKPEFRVTE